MVLLLVETTEVGFTEVRIEEANERLTRLWVDRR